MGGGSRDFFFLSGSQVILIKESGSETGLTYIYLTCFTWGSYKLLLPALFSQLRICKKLTVLEVGHRIFNFLKFSL